MIRFNPRETGARPVGSGLPKLASFDTLGSTETFETTSPGVAPGRSQPIGPVQRGRATFPRHFDLDQPHLAWRKVRVCSES